MNRCWQVTRTYLGRWRFWIFGALYACVALWIFPTYWAPPEVRPDDGLVATGFVLSMLAAAILGCLAALHLRRLLSGPAGHAVPGFWGPHLLIGAVVGLVIWVAVPWGQAEMTDISHLRMVSIASLAGTLSSLVLLWPRAIFLLGLIPAAMVWIGTGRPGSALLLRFYHGDAPIASVAAIVLAVVAYPMAALLLARSRDRAASFTDDLAVDRSHEVAARWKQPLLQLRDAAIEWRLGSVGHLAWPLRRWLIPCAASWSEIGLLLALVIVVMTLTGLASDTTGSLIVASGASLIALFIPLSVWRFRCTALAGECMLPVARRQFARQFMAAMLCDFAIWTAVATAIVALGYLPLLWIGEPGVLENLGLHASFLWSAAVLVYSTALVTLRIRFWIPWFLGVLFVTLFGGYFTWGFLTYWWFEVLKFPETRVLLFGSFFAVFGGVGLLLGSFSYWRWLRMEIR